VYVRSTGWLPILTVELWPEALLDISAPSGIVANWFDGAGAARRSSHLITPDLRLRYCGWRAIRSLSFDTLITDAPAAAPDRAEFGQVDPAP
jgi:hypothetical protein